MNIFKRGVLLAGSMFFIFATVSSAHAEDKAGVTDIVVVNMVKILQTTSAAKDIQTQFEKKRKEYQAKITAQEKELRAAEDELRKQKTVLSADEFQDKRKSFEERVLKAQKMVQDHRRVLDTAMSKALNDLKTEAAKIVAKIADERDISIVLSHESVVLAAKSLDITDEVVKRLNSDVKKIKIDWSPAKKK